MDIQASFLDELPDHAAEEDDRNLAIDRVGIRGLSYPIQVLDRSNGVQHTVADVALFVSLPHHFKGTHMSRFVEILNARRGEITIRNVPAILTEIQTRLEADDAHMEVRFPYFLTRRAPVSGIESLMEYRCGFFASKSGDEVDFHVRVEVPVTSLCPCSKAVSERGAHNQRSLVTAEVRSTDFVWIEDIVEAVEKCASSPLYALLKREDEKFVTEAAYDNPKFVEDLVRDTVVAVGGLPGVTWLRVTADNQESIHNHSAYAEIEGPVSREQEHQESLPLPTKSDPEPATFGTWLKQARTSRNFSQSEFADLVGVSAGFLSRVESGEKMLSAATLDSAALALGHDPVEVRLRSGVLPPDLLARIATDPAGFRRWAGVR